VGAVYVAESNYSVIISIHWKFPLTINILSRQQINTLAVYIVY